MVGQMDHVFVILLENGTTTLLNGTAERVVASVCLGKRCDPAAIDMLVAHLESGHPTAINNHIVTRLA